jgi:hypothetical protein
MARLSEQVGRVPCPANSYCPDGVNTLACPANTVSVAYSTKPSDCKTALGYPPTSPYTVSPLPPALDRVLAI